MDYQQVLLELANEISYRRGGNDILDAKITRLRKLPERGRWTQHWSDSDRLIALSPDGRPAGMVPRRFGDRVFLEGRAAVA